MLSRRARLLRRYVHMALPFFIVFSYILSYTTPTLPYLVRISMHMIFGIVSTLMVFILAGFYTWSLFKGAKMLRDLFFYRLARLLQFFLLFCFILVGVTGFLAIHYPFNPFYIVVSWHQVLVEYRSMLLDMHGFFVHIGFFILLLHALLGMRIVFLRWYKRRKTSFQLMHHRGGVHGRT